MSEKVLHTWTADDHSQRLIDIGGGPIHQKMRENGEWGLTGSAHNGDWTDELARLAARVAELEGEKEKLRACVVAADAFFLTEDAMVNATEEGVGKDLWLESQEHRNAYDAARAEVDNG